MSPRVLAEEDFFEAMTVLEMAEARPSLSGGVLRAYQHSDLQQKINTRHPHHVIKKSLSKGDDRALADIRSLAKFLQSHLLNSV